MAFQNTLINTGAQKRRNATPPLWARIAAGFAAIGNALVDLASRNQRLQDLSRLEALSDAQLAEMGLRRETLVHHVFRDRFYL